MAPLFSVCHITGRLSMGQGSRISEIDSDWLSVFCFLGEKKREKQPRGLYSQGWTQLADCAVQDFHSC
jgi:hypothetical protein